MAGVYSIVKVGEATGEPTQEANRIAVSQRTLQDEVLQA
jgi:hypothetical protein